MLVWHVTPVQPAKQVHKKALCTGVVHAPREPQGLDKHSSMFTLQVAPLQPGLHEHEKPPTRSWQVPPLEQGTARHSLMLVWQRAPSKPKLQAQVKPFTASAHTPW